MAGNPISMTMAGAVNNPRNGSLFDLLDNATSLEVASDYQITAEDDYLVYLVNGGVTITLSDGAKDTGRFSFFSKADSSGVINIDSPSGVIMYPPSPYEKDYIATGGSDDFDTKYFHVAIYRLAILDLIIHHFFA